MQFFHNLKSDFSLRWNLLLDRTATRERRVFAGLEIFCYFVSFLTVFVLLPLQIASARIGWNIPGAFSVAVGVLLSAAVGYITNYIAIEMLFKPYDKTKKHPLSIVTFGYWRQGLVPRNKDQIGEELGEQIEKKLLNPQQLADELCKMVVEFIQNKQIIENLRNSVQQLLHANEQKIIDYLIPQIEQSLLMALNSHLTRESILELWRNNVQPFLAKGETRKMISAEIIDGLKHQSPQLTEILKNEIRNYCRAFLSENLPFGAGAETLSNGFVSFINWNDIEKRLREKLGDERFFNMVQDEMLVLGDKLNSWMSSPDGKSKVDSFVNEIKQKLRSHLHDYLQNELPAIANGIIDSESLWSWIENDLLPSARPKLESLIHEEGKELVIEKLNLSTRIAESVKKQDVREFHSMINSIAAQHLGAIQVLGYFLGLLIGLTQLLL